MTPTCDSKRPASASIDARFSAWDRASASLASRSIARLWRRLRLNTSAVAAIAPTSSLRSVPYTSVSSLPSASPRRQATMAVTGRTMPNCDMSQPSSSPTRMPTAAAAMSWTARRSASWEASSDSRAALSSV